MVFNLSGLPQVHHSYLSGQMKYALPESEIRAQSFSLHFECQQTDETALLDAKFI